MTFMGAIANGGEQRLPSLIAGMEGKKGEQLISPVTAGLLKEMMANNVTQSYGSSNFPGLKICAKSGTAEVGSGANPHAWFAGFLDDPNNPYAFVVISSTAAPEAKWREVSRTRCFRHLSRAEPAQCGTLSGKSRYRMRKNCGMPR